MDKAPPETKPPRTRKLFRLLGIALLAAAVSVAGLAVAAVAVVRHVAARIVVAPLAVGRAIHQGVATVIRDGSHREKLDLLASFEPLTPADLAPFLPLFEEAAMDEDVEVGRAADKLLARARSLPPR